MSRLDKLEEIYFDESPRAFRDVGLFIMGAGILVSLVLGFISDDGFTLGHLWFAAIAALPAVTCLFLSNTIAQRHALTVPLTILLCAMSAYVFVIDPRIAAEGVTPYLPTLIGVTIVIALEVVAIVSLIAFVVYLWRKGAFAR